MPMKWVDPEVFCMGTNPSGDEVTVYHVYKNDEFSQGRRTYWYTLNPLEGEGSTEEFDVRDLPPEEHPDREAVLEGDHNAMRRFLIAEIAAGRLKPKDEDDENDPAG